MCQDEAFCLICLCDNFEDWPLLATKSPNGPNHVYAHEREGDDGCPDDEGVEHRLLEALFCRGGIVGPRKGFVGDGLVKELAQGLPSVGNLHLEETVLGDDFPDVLVVALKQICQTVPG